MLLIGMDLVKDSEVLEAAYDDADGVTAAFNKNLAVRINRELGGTIPLDALAHEAVWNDDLARVEMHLFAHAEVQDGLRPPQLLPSAAVNRTTPKKAAAR